MTHAEEKNSSKNSRGHTVTPRLDRRPDLFKMIARFGKTDVLQKADEGPLGDQPQSRP
ncbi:MAG TPA: hypothetical protein VIK53_17015 [Verrucomicrobiae bacterium]